MKLFLLPGNSASNESWIERVKSELNDVFEDLQIQYYAHWKRNDVKVVDLDAELENLLAETSRVPAYCIFAKSAGALLALRGIYEAKVKPAKCIFVGLPVLWARQNGFDIDRWIKNYSIQSLFIQQSGDPAFSFSQLKDYLANNNVRNYKLVQVMGKDHDYQNINELKKHIVPF